MTGTDQSRRRLIIVVFICFAAFLLANGLSYFFWSDKFGAPGWEDAVKRIGFPFVFREEGGFAYRLIFDVPKLLLDLAIGIMASATGALLYSKVKS